GFALACSFQYSLSFVLISNPIMRGMTKDPITYFCMASSIASWSAKDRRSEGPISQHAISQIQTQRTVLGDNEKRSVALRIRAASTRGHQGSGPSCFALSISTLSSFSETMKRFSIGDGILVLGFPACSGFRIAGVSTK